MIAFGFRGILATYPAHLQWGPPDTYKVLNCKRPFILAPCSRAVWTDLSITLICTGYAIPVLFSPAVPSGAVHIRLLGTFGNIRGARSSQLTGDPGGSNQNLSLRQLRKRGVYPIHPFGRRATPRTEFKRRRHNTIRREKLLCAQSHKAVNSMTSAIPLPVRNRVHSFVTSSAIERFLVASFSTSPRTRPGFVLPK